MFAAQVVCLILFGLHVANSDLLLEIMQRSRSSLHQSRVVEPSLLFRYCQLVTLCVYFFDYITLNSVECRMEKICFDTKNLQNVNCVKVYRKLWKNVWKDKTWYKIHHLLHLVPNCILITTAQYRSTVHSLGSVKVELASRVFPGVSWSRPARVGISLYPLI